MLHCIYCDYFKVSPITGNENFCRSNLCIYSNVEFTDADLDLLTEPPCHCSNSNRNAE